MSKWDDLKQQWRMKLGKTQESENCVKYSKRTNKECKENTNEYAQDYAEISKRNIKVAKYDADTDKYIFIPFTDVYHHQFLLHLSLNLLLNYCISDTDDGRSDTDKPRNPVSQFKGTATSSVVAPAQIQTQAEKSQPIFTTSLDPLTEVRDASSEPPPLVSSREPS